MESVDAGSLPAKDTTTVSVREIPLRNGENASIPTLHVTRMPLFHGSSAAGISAFDLEQSDQMTIGRGVYFTPNRETAIDYARRRSGDSSTPILYEAEIKDVEIADLRTRQAQEQFAKLHKQALLDWEQNVLPHLKGQPAEVVQKIKEVKKEKLDEVIKKIDENSWVSLRDLTFGWADLVTSTLSTHGYKALMAVEGEPPQIDLHDSVVIFDPKDAPIIHEQPATLLPTQV